MGFFRSVWNFLTRKQVEIIKKGSDVEIIIIDKQLTGIQTVQRQNGKYEIRQEVPSINVVGAVKGGEVFDKPRSFVKKGNTNYLYVPQAIQGWFNGFDAKFHSCKAIILPNYGPSLLFLGEERNGGGDSEE